MAFICILWCQIDEDVKFKALSLLKRKKENHNKSY